MTLRFRLSMLYRQQVHRTLLFLSRTYRESSVLQDRLNLETSSHTSTKAKLALSEGELASARSQIQSLTIAAQRASEDAARFRDERDSAREQALEAREAGVRPMQDLADWLAQGQPRRPIFGMAPAVEPEPMQEGPIGAVRGRAVAQEGTRQEFAVSMKELAEIQARQRRDRAAAMADVHLDGEPS